MKSSLVIMISLPFLIGMVPSRAVMILDAIEQVESGGVSDFVSDKGRKVGILQIDCDFVDDVNKIINSHAYEYSDRTSVRKSREMFLIWHDYWCNRRGDWSNKGIALRNAGGPNGTDSCRHLPYWRMVRIKLSRGSI